MASPIWSLMRMIGLSEFMAPCGISASVLQRTLRSSRHSTWRQVDAVEHDLAAHDAARRLHHAQDRHGRRRLAAARFTHQAQDLALVDLEAHVVHGAHVAGGWM